MPFDPFRPDPEPPDTPEAPALPAWAEWLVQSLCVAVLIGIGFAIYFAHAPVARLLLAQP